jgi:tRNA U55 pseudouridine synthase TruB
MHDLVAVQRAAEEGADALLRHLLPPDRALLHWPEQRLDSVRATRFARGQAVAVDAGTPDDRSCLVRVYGTSQGFMGVGELTGTGTLKPRRVFSAGA